MHQNRPRQQEWHSVVQWGPDYKSTGRTMPPALCTAVPQPMVNRVHSRYSLQDWCCPDSAVMECAQELDGVRFDLVGYYSTQLSHT